MTLENQTIFILGATKYDSIYESTSFTTAKFLAKTNFVYYIDFPFTHKDFFNSDLKEVIEKRKPYFSDKSDNIISELNYGLKIIVLPLLFSINFLPEGAFYRFLLDINEKLIKKRLDKIISQHDLKDIIFINSFNFHYPNIGKLIKAKLSVYHCVDPLIIGYDKKHGVISEQIVAKSSDLVICTSFKLYKEKKQVNENTFFIPNAADLKFSSLALDPKLSISSIFSGISRPIIGYFGNIERRMDFALLKDVVRANSDKSFVFIGPVTEEFMPSDFRTIPNVFLMGSVPYAEMPSVIKGFDIAIIPFKKDDVSETIFPLKLFEYLGSGKPVIATDFNLDLVDFTQDTVRYCGSEKTFTNAINYFLKNDDEELKLARLAIAAENTWDKRLTELSELISKYFSTKTREND